MDVGVGESQVTKESFIDGWFFKTGDAVKVDEDGYYVILGRTSADILKVGGYKLSALEIEAALLEHPAAAECCLLGLPDRDYGEAVCYNCTRGRCKEKTRGRVEACYKLGRTSHLG